MDQQIWQWTLTREAIAPCFVRDVLAMRKHTNGDADFFWLGHTPCRTVLLVGMVVGIQVYDKRAIYTIDDGTAVIDCVLRHPHPTIPAPVPRLPPRPTGDPYSKPNSKRPSPKKPRLDKTTLGSTEPPPPITEPGYPVRVVGRVVRHHQSKQIYADTIDPCPSSLDEIAHLERVIELHKTKYSLAVPFVPPPTPASRVPPVDTPTGVDASIFSSTSHLSSHLNPSTTSYALSPPPMPMPLQSRNRPLPLPFYPHSAHHNHTHVPSSPTASSVVSSTSSSPCKPTSSVKSHQAQLKPKMRHPSRLHTRDLTGNTFRLYVKHYMDYAPCPFPTSSPSPITYEKVKTPTRRARDEDERDEQTPRPRPSTRNVARDGEGGEDELRPTLGFTLSHLRRVPELALLATRVVRAEARRRDKADRESEQRNSHSRITSAAAHARSKGSKNGGGISADPPRQKMKRLFSWAVVKLYEEGSIVLWDGDVRPLPVPPPPVPEGVGDQNRNTNGPWKEDSTNNTSDDPSVLSHSLSYAPGYPFPSTSGSLYSHYHPPQRSTKRRSESEYGKTDASAETDVDPDADSGYVSDPGMDEEAYVPLTPQLLGGYIKNIMGVLRRRCRAGGGRGGVGAGVDRTGPEPTPEDVLTYLKQMDGRWARVGLWAVEEALAVLKVR